MDRVEPNLILKFNDDQIHNVRKALGYEDVNKLKQDIEHLRDWIQKQNHFKVKEFDIEFLERLLIYGKGKLRGPNRNLINYVLIPTKCLSFFKTLIYNCVLPRPTNDNYRIFVTYFTGEEGVDVYMINHYRYIIVLAYYLMNYDYCHGFEYILDARNITLGLVKKTNPLIVHRAFELITGAMGHRMKKIHIITGSKLLDTMLTIFKQGMSAKLQQRIVMHSNFESLYEHIPRELLPIDYGGDAKSLKEIYDSTFKELSSDEHVARMKFMETIGTDESCRLASKFNEEYSGTPGSFKSLCVD